MSSQERILEIFLSLLDGRSITKSELQERYGVNLRTIQRDLALIKQQLAVFSTNLELVYNEKNHCYTLYHLDRLSAEEILIVSKVLLESRALNTSEMSKIIDHLLNTLSSEMHTEIKKLIANEARYYQPLVHKKELVQQLWQFSRWIDEHLLLNFTYKKNRGQLVERTAVPVSLFFSEYYFYVLCYNPKYKSYLSYRLDRFEMIEPTREKLFIPYKDRLQEGELRKKIHFMYAGREVTFTFQFWGIIEAALDKLPNSKILEKFSDGSVIIQATAYDTGVMMWLLSQGHNVKVLTPPSFVEKIKLEIAKMNGLYND